MKTIKLLAALLIIVLISGISFRLGRNYEEQYFNTDLQKDREAAYLLGGFIKSTIDIWDGEDIWNGGLELENSFEEYFQDLDLNPDLYYIKSFKDINEYLNI